MSSTAASAQFTQAISKHWKIASGRLNLGASTCDTKYGVYPFNPRGSIHTTIMELGPKKTILNLVLGAYFHKGIIDTNYLNLPFLRTHVRKFIIRSPKEVGSLGSRYGLYILYNSYNLGITTYLQLLVCEVWGFRYSVTAGYFAVAPDRYLVFFWLALRTLTFWVSI